MIVAQSVSREKNPSKPTAACVTFALTPQRKAPRSLTASPSSPSQRLIFP
jgi:hypothetical protein